MSEQKPHSELREAILASIDVDWYGPNPEYAAVVEKGKAAVESLVEQLEASEEKLRIARRALWQITTLPEQTEAYDSADVCVTLALDALNATGSNPASERDVEQLEAARAQSREASEMFLKSDAYVGELRAALEKIAAWPPHDGMLALCEFAREALSNPASERDVEQLEAARETLNTLIDGWALELVERVESNHNELQRLGLTERENSEASRKLLSSMATDAVYFAALIREARASNPANERDVGGTGPQAGDGQPSRRLTPQPRAASADSKPRARSS